jgi:hypothetical protein
MHTRTRRLTTRRSIINLTVPLLIAFACYASGAAHAAKAEAGKPGVQSGPSSNGKSGFPLATKPSMNLKLDTGLRGTSLAEAEEDCEDDVASAANTTGSQWKPATVIAQADTPKTAQTWEIVPTDKTLNAALARWARSAGWQLVWELPVDYSVEARTTVPGTFEEAVGLVAKSMDTAEIPMKAIFYAGNKVLRIVAKGAE